MLRKIAVIMLVCAVVLSAWGTTVQAKDKKVVIGAAMSLFSDKWLSYMHDGIRRFGEEHEDVKIMMTDGKDDPAVQLNQIETLLTQGVDVILLCPVDVSAMEPIIAAVQSAGVPIVVINRFPEQEIVEQIDVYCGSESIRAGIMQAEWIVEALGPEGGKVGIMTGMPGHEAATMRTEGNKQVFAKHPNIEIVIEATGRWERALGMQVAENWIQSGRDLKAIVSNNDEMAIGSLLAAEAAGIKDEDLLIAGVDATSDALEFLGKGLDVTVFQSADGQGYGGAEAAYKIVKGEEVEKMQWIPYELVTTENMKDYQ
ncbi:MAG: sugar ABC transporter substrate-binding protein [bacterium]|nr:sugar ABC transporter substrate-binding protein [bacterium]